MLAVVRTPRTKKTTLEIRGQIPRWMMIRLRREYKSRLTIREETLKLEPQVENVFATPWFADVEKGGSSFA